MEDKHKTAITAKMPAVTQEEPWIKNPILKWLFALLCLFLVPFLALYMWIRHPILCLKQAKKSLKEDFGG